MTWNLVSLGVEGKQSDTMRAVQEGCRECVGFEGGAEEVVVGKADTTDRKRAVKQLVTARHTIMYKKPLLPIN